MDIVDDGHCFACGDLNEHGLQLSFSVDLEKGTAETDYVVAKKFNGWQDTVHGGIISTMLDESMVYACGASGFFVVTGELTVRFRKPVPVEKEITLRARVTSKKSKLMEAEAEIVLEGEKLATAKGRMFVMRPLTAEETASY